MSKELDALVAERVFYWRCWLETRGDYALAVWVAKGEAEPWKCSRHGTDERYMPCSVAAAFEAGFYGTPPRWGKDISDAWLVVEEMRKRTFNFDFHARKGRMVAFFTIMRGSENDVYARGEADTAPEAICLAALEALK